MNNTSIQTPNGAERRQYKANEVSNYATEGIQYVRSQLVDRVLNPDTVNYKYRDLLLSVLSAEVL